jgi:hypothetical protein
MKKMSRKARHIGSISIGSVVLVLYVLSQQNPGANGLYNASKLVEWTGMVFVFLFGLNWDLFVKLSTWLVGLVMLGMHALVLWKCYPILPSLNYIAIAAIALLEGFVFEIPFLGIRKRLDPRPRPGRRRLPSL